MTLNWLGKQRKLYLIVTFLLFVGMMISPIEASTLDLSQLSIAELMNLEIIPVVTSVSRRSEKVTETPAAVFVITSEDIKRSGATSIPEALRLAPGLSVAQINSNNWSISARGTNGEYVNNLLVMIDGRSVYSPLWGGVEWDVQDTILEDIERIEVVRGPGGTTWGANAVNGIINIVTKATKDTQGQLLTIGNGNDQSELSYRYGGKLGDVGTFRFYLKQAETESLLRRNNEISAMDENERLRWGFRTDWKDSDDRNMTFEFSSYKGKNSEKILEVYRSEDAPPQSLGKNGVLVVASGPVRIFEAEDVTNLSGYNLRFSINQNLASENKWKLQFYFDRAHRSNKFYEETINTFDVDFQHSFRLHRRHEFVWGLGVRQIDYSVPIEEWFDLNASTEPQTIKSFFAQDTITLKPDKLFWTIGTKLYDHPYVGLEKQPNSRLYWKPSDKHHFWTAFTETRRVPTVVERSRNDFVVFYNITSGIDIEEILQSSNNELKSEITQTKEIGYRYLPNDKFALDLTYFEHDSSNLARLFTKRPPPSEKRGVARILDDGELLIKGTEMSFQWKPSSKFRLVGGYTASSYNEKNYPIKVFSPKQFFFRTYWNIRDNLTLDLSYNNDSYEADEIHVFDDLKRVTSITHDDILNLRLGWKVNRSCEISIVGKNLLYKQKQEFPKDYEVFSGSYEPSEIPRTFYLKATWSF